MRSTLLALVALAAASTAAAQAPPHCTAHVAEVNARTLYEALPRTRDADGCLLDEVSGQPTRIVVNWEKAGTATAAAFVVPNACAPDGAVRGPAFSVTVPASAEAECPTGARALRGVVSRSTLGGLGHETKNFHVPMRAVWWAAGIAAFIALLVVLRRRRPAP